MYRKAIPQLGDKRLYYNAVLRYFYCRMCQYIKIKNLDFPLYMSNNKYNRKEIVRIRCPNILCLYEWNYKGILKFYATCPNCRKCIRIDENAVSNSQTMAVGVPIS